MVSTASFILPCLATWMSISTVPPASGSCRKSAGWRVVGCVSPELAKVITCRLGRDVAVLLAPRNWMMAVPFRFSLMLLPLLLTCRVSPIGSVEPTFRSVFCLCVVVTVRS